MGNECRHNLIVVGLNDRDLDEFAEALEQETGCEIGIPLKLTRQFQGKTAFNAAQGQTGVAVFEFQFVTSSGTRVWPLQRLSKKHARLTLLLSYSSWASGFRGQAVIKHGRVMEHTHRLGYNG